MSTTTTQPKSFIFTGWHMLAILVAFFGVVISVNLLMASYASSSWSGLISNNTYVASQDFNIKAAEARAWAAEGFKGDFNVTDTRLEYVLEGPMNKVDQLQEVTAIFHRPVGERQDFTMKLARVGSPAKPGANVFDAEHNLAAGPWIVDLAAIEGGKTVFHQAERIIIGGK